MKTLVEIPGYTELEVNFGDEDYGTISGKTNKLALRVGVEKILTNTNYCFTTIPEELAGASLHQF